MSWASWPGFRSRTPKNLRKIPSQEPSFNGRCLTTAKGAAMNKGIAAFALACFLSAVVCAQQKVIKDVAEYNAYITALNQQEPVAKADAMESFVATYPNSVVKIDA